MHSARALLVLLALTSETTLAQSSSIDALAHMSLEELSNIEVTSVSRFPERLTETASAAYIITRDEIRRSGARSIPEALRLAPGVQVARVGAFGWAISMRGFDGDLSNKLLVLIDGRSVYSPLYAGVFWDVQDYVLEDIDRIEVIAGPGGTLWGANAVNGVINIITRSARETQGTFASAGAGRQDPFFGAARYGGTLGEHTQARAYVKYLDRDDVRRLDSTHFDDGHILQGGFRIDGEAAQGSFTWHGDAYRGDRRALLDRDFTLGTLPRGPAIPPTELRGANTLAQWQRSAERSDWTAQLYWNYTERDIPFTFDERRNTADLDVQQRYRVGARQDLLWGAEIRVSSDRLKNSVFAAFLPDERTDWTYSGFLQDRIALITERLFLTVGSKLEHNDYTGFEAQPNIRLAWLPSERQTLWAAVSRAVRTPSRLDSDLQLTVPLSIPSVPVPIYARVNGSERFSSERLLAYEAGWRMQPNDRVHLDVATFYNHYDKLQTQEPLTPIVVAGAQTYILLPNVLSNGKRAHSYGGTAVTSWQPLPSWQVKLDYTYFHMVVQQEPWSLDRTARGVEGDTPRNQLTLESFLDVTPKISVFLAARHAGELPDQGIQAYTTLDASVQWRPIGKLELSVSGRDLFDRVHSEFGAPKQNAIGRTVYGSVALRL